jgi:hypothetical protein
MCYKLMGIYFSTSHLLKLFAAIFEGYLKVGAMEWHLFASYRSV